MTKEILCTLGPASMNDQVIRRLEELGATLFRINLSHTKLDDVADAVRFVTSRTRVPLSLDTEGAQIRTGTLVEPVVEMRENTIVYAHRTPVPGDAENFNFYPYDILPRFQAGDLISIDFNAVLVQVVEPGEDKVAMRVLNGGPFGRNKAVSVDREIDMPPLTEKDLGAIAIGMELGVRHYALSFANRGEDVETLRAIVGGDSTIISKIECRNGIRNLDRIAELSDALLIDRGDLSREVPIELIPACQKMIIRKCAAAGRKVYVATNLLESMVSSPVPTRAEVNDIHNTLLDGADGVVLAAETAIGCYPIQCANMISRMIDVFENRNFIEEGQFVTDPVSQLVDPHGGYLVHRVTVPGADEDIADLPTLELGETDLLDCEQIAYGTYSPLTGFMDSETLQSVIRDNRLPDGTIWTLPVILQCDAATAARFGAGERIVLRDAAGTPQALLDLTEVYEFDQTAIIPAWFGTDDENHPGVRRVVNGGTHCLAGAVTLLRRNLPEHKHFVLHPSQTRAIFAHKGWSRVVGFHTRNPCHRAHEYIQLTALARTGADGLYINPAVGPKKAGDFLTDPIMKSYHALLGSGVYPRGKAVLGGFATYSRYAGPREAVFTALCRKNMGCSHFIVGRDHTGVSNFYGADANRRMFESLPDLGIVPVFFDAVGYDPGTEMYAEGESNVYLSVSGTEVRDRLRRGERLPDWFIRAVVQDHLLGETAAGRPLFYADA